MFDNIIKNKIKEFFAKFDEKVLTKAGYKSVSIVMEIIKPNQTSIQPRLILKTFDDKIINIDGIDNIMKKFEEIRKNMN